ncbi:uncharacterized protein HMPREF1541_01068 [Cyphellophora europaea CBS 101466]|uniref:DH domain-containing protein n=1 Tax=Cyphellophora europaea (strain CBS 101466) TaxID=1220924 RepID=W2SG88_CYPE1|nr:uncharacterized protein HMPREF1541_01068 [Cyphellophora europaea CBS 101466]ETN46879.1 hypothetical protein HMPREF1541_01068 [Cyphellophora europaea CBS 101466]
MTTTQLLPSIVSHPFQNAFDDKPYSIQDVDPQQRSPAASGSSFNNPSQQRPRQVSPASILSVASAPLPYNNENIAPTPLKGVFSQPQSRVPSINGDRPGTSTCVPHKPVHHILASRPSTSSVAPVRHIQADGGRHLDDTSRKDELLRNALEDLERYKSSRVIAANNLPPRPQSGVKESSESTSIPYQDTAPEMSAPQVSSQNTIPAKPSPQTPVRHHKVMHSASSGGSQTPARSPMQLHTRQSTSSSGFVHTIKTASFSNISFSMLSKRLKHGRSSESRFLFGSHSRFSSDSDRPATVSSMDESALWRSVKRRRIFEEILTTEESYVADLKALVYLMSTLLASATSLPSRVRNLVQKNVLDLLHLHEGLVEKLHGAAYKAAARKWADTLSPQSLGSPRHLRWRSLDSHIVYRPSSGRRHARSSLDSTNAPPRTRARFLGTDPVDLTEIIDIYRSAMASFFAYEEYCANHEIIAHDLQRHLPNLWSTYESGMESLARSLVALDKRAENGRKALTVGDLLIKPIQRICKYPLLFDELLAYTPSSDDPSVHAELEIVLQCLRDIVESVNNATVNPEIRLQIHRRWSLRSRLIFERTTLTQEDFRLLGNASLCGVLHVAYQTKHGITGTYALCVLFRQHLLIAFHVTASQRFDIVAFINLHDLKIDSASDGKGLQSPAAFHTWKLSFAVEGRLNEFLLSASSAVEEEQWKRGLRGELADATGGRSMPKNFPSSVALDLRSVGVIYGRQGTLARRLSVQRAATVGSRTSISQVIIRNTHNPEELHEFRQPSTTSVNRSQSHMTSNRIVILAPKRSERTRLESLLNDIWTKDKLPYPGMIGSRGGQIIRASAGSLARKLSLASIQGSFSRRSASLTVSSKKSYETLSVSRGMDRMPTFEIWRDSVDERPTSRHKRKTSHDVPELDSMDTVVNRMIGDSMPMHTIPSTPKDDGIHRTGVLHKQPVQVTSLPIGPDDSAQAFYPEEVEKMQNTISVEESLAGKHKKRWSNPMGILKGRAAEGFRHMLYSTR